MQSEILLAPFRLIWEFLPPISAIPTMAVLALAVIWCVVDLSLFIMFGTETEVEARKEREGEWKFYPEDFEQ